MASPRQTLDRIVHPPCHPTPFTPLALTFRVLLIGFALVVLALIWPTWWWVLVAVVIGTMLVTHPFCLLTGKKHAPGGHWFHFE